MKLFALVLAAAPVFAAGSVQQSLQKLGSGDNYVLTMRWTGDASDGTVPATNATLGGCCQGYRVTSVQFQPGSPAPTSGYSGVLADPTGADIIGGGGATLSSTVTNSVSPSTSAPLLVGAFTLRITGNAVASAKGAAYIFMTGNGIVLATAGTSNYATGGSMTGPLVFGGYGIDGKNQIAGYWPNPTFKSFASEQFTTGNGSPPNDQPQFAFSAYARSDTPLGAGVGLLAACQAGVSSASCFGSNIVAFALPGITSPRMIGLEIDMEPSLGVTPAASGSGGLFINAFNEVFAGAAIQISGQGGGLFTNGIGFGALSDTGGALYSIPNPGTYTITGAVNNGSGLCRVTLNSAPYEINTGTTVTIASIAGATGCNGDRSVTRVGTNPLQWDLAGTTFGGTYTSGGTMVRKWTSDSFINTTSGAYRSDPLIVGNNQGLRMCDTGGCSTFFRIYNDTANNLHLVPGGGGLMIVRNAADTLNTGTLLMGATRLEAQTYATRATYLNNDGMIGYCSDCTVAACATPGSGAFIGRRNSAYTCW